jgi:hypothetical protein
MPPLHPGLLDLHKVGDGRCDFAVISIRTMRASGRGGMISGIQARHLDFVLSKEGM